MNDNLGNWLLTPAAMGRADLAAAGSGIDSYGLMEKAGQAVAAAALRLFPGGLRFAVLCGPGNNGGDGYVAARALAEAGAPVAVFHLGDPARLKGDAATAHTACWLSAEPLERYQARAGDVIIDAIFGAGLDRTVPASVADAITAVDGLGLPVIAVDLPSGLDGRSGRVLGAAFRAVHTVTFMTRKPGHLLMPGRMLCGSVEVFDIGIPRRILAAELGTVAVNGPEVWRRVLPQGDGEMHKFRRGHLTVFSGPAHATGAARLSAMAGLKAGAGLVTVASPSEALAVNAAQLTAVMLKAIDSRGDLEAYLCDPRHGAFVLGPGFGVAKRARDFALALRDRRLVLDADGITAFRDEPHSLFEAFADGDVRLVLTPHEGEFGRLFPDLATDDGASKIDRALAASARAHAVVVYKGSDTVIAGPDGRALINTNAPPSLATAGSGDVLAGIIGGLLAQGMPTFEAAAAGVWLHGEAATRAGASLTAEELITHIER
ncbi:MULTISPECIES: NAD(P)H-hydrate dehydratase [Alphaproteobacteria]|uniref:Bifunctional NAD(P)H-hydrate repair enzyme n=2 Tax=Alphaproteobacteria TaxID=28211 RepID=A0A512HCZ6_9HYPH|nr:MULTISPECIES: NAD(P)H-hydrate dehydratase [Alphaproteobacteria]GEO83328.1 bifunctional NAD(P)H-hydrate repair enzyme [Ciceribacter naphthalenivorans]GLR20278.1 bifunctional NAD(P)H-hydrate repair enzyme [Ciceribacter naphthalenivorans]GLT03134.1 bifunctional NAD(P)H-hydrate repair enzyme [Sphingomonas psychrolutea]